MISVLLFAFLIGGLIFCADDLDRARCDLTCPCGRRSMKSVMITSESQAREIEQGLTANCPWCLKQYRDCKGVGAVPPKGVDIHA